MRNRAAPRAFGLELLIAAGFLFGAMALGLWIGSVANLSWEMTWDLRLPRVLLACATGAGLALAGAALQALFANPLCEPYTLGISSGAALGAVLAAGSALEWAVAGLALPALGGSLAFAAFLLLVSLRSLGSSLVLLLSGVMLSLLGSSLVALRMALADSSGMQSAIFWLMGDLSRARLGGALVLLFLVIILGVALFWRSRQLDALMLGEDRAAALGVDVARVRRETLLLSSALVGLCVSASGMIGFVGLVVPHFVRRIGFSPLHTRLLPLSALVGAAVLVLADAVARKWAAPLELPVGVVTAIVGAPLFVWILLSRGRISS